MYDFKSFLINQENKLKSNSNGKQQDEIKEILQQVLNYVKILEEKKN